jgi:murein DD-endopeptidase MepM/ murein hydrolase activator NlpD
MQTKHFLSFTLAALVAGCAINGAPAPVVEGKIQRTWQQAPRTASAQPLTRPAAPQATIALATPIAPVVNEQPLANIQPAAGPMQAPTMPIANRFTTVEVEAAGPPTPEGTSTLHTVQPTDTLFKIARTYNTTPEAIIRVNALKNSADVESGRTLTIPANTRSATPSLAERVTNYLRTPPTATAAAQPTPVAPVAAQPIATTPAPAQFEMARIEPAAGKQPEKPEPKTTSLKHTVKAGETIYRISKQYNLSVLDVMAANDLERPEALQAGMVLNIPQQPTKAATPATKATEQAATKPILRPAAELGITEATRATITPTPTEAGTRALNDPDKGTDTAATIRPLRPTAPITEKEKLRAELKRGQIDRDAARARGLIWPARGNLTKKYGEKGNGVAHTGINIAVPANTPVLATESGTVLYADGGLRAYGNMVLVRHANGMVSAYAHLNHLLVRKGERVQKGQVLAMSGQTGNVESPQLHFELRRNATAIDPLTVLPN